MLRSAGFVGLIVYMLPSFPHNRQFVLYKVNKREDPTFESDGGVHIVLLVYVHMSRLRRNVLLQIQNQVERPKI